MRKFSTVEIGRNPKETFDPSKDSFTTALINRKVNMLIDRLGFRYHEREDLKQELLARVIKGLESYDASIGTLNPFITAVVDRQVSNILRARNADKRSSGAMVSLNVNIKSEDAGPTELLQTISNREVDRRLGRERTLSEEQLNDLKSDMGNVIARLPKRLQDFLELKKTLSLNEIVNELGVSRSTLGDWMDEIRAHFEEAGLEKYFYK